MKFKEKKWYKVINKIIRTFLSTIVTLLLIISGILLFFVINAKVAQKKGEEYKAPVSLYTIISPSMVPNLNVYDVTVDVKTDPNKLKVGDIITFASSSEFLDGMIITHRIIGVIRDENGLQFRTKGDANQSPDSSLVLENNIIGKSLFKIPQLGRVQFILASKGGWFILILLPALGVLSYDIMKLLKLFILKSKISKIQNDLNKKE